MFEQFTLGIEEEFQIVDPITRELKSHVSEILDGEAPHQPGGCPFQAWSLAEVLRLEESVLGRDE